MNLWLILLQAGLSIAKEHGAPGEVTGTGGFLIDAARAIDELYEKEVGQPMDWSKIRHHEHLGPPGEPEMDSEIDPPAAGEPEPTAEDPTDPGPIE